MIIKMLFENDYNDTYSLFVKCIYHTFPDCDLSPFQIKTSLLEMLDDIENIDRDSLIQETEILQSKKAFRNCRVLIGIMYWQLYKVSNSLRYLREAVFWKSICNETSGKNHTTLLYPNDTKQLGILHGVSGLLFLNMCLSSSKSTLL